MINRKNLFTKKARISYFEILTLMIATCAFSYMVYETTILKESDSPNGFGVFLEKIFNFVGKPMFALASADPTLQCCQHLTNGATCQDVLNTSDCSSGQLLQGVQCAQSSACKPGCCINDTTGTYDKNSPQTSCSGRWIDDKNCNLNDARNGCCVIKSQTYFTTQQNCVWRTGLQGNGNSVDWRGSLNEAQCVLLSQVQEQGACMTGNNCKFTTRADCASLNGNFFSNYLCTSPELNSSCTKTSNTECVNGKDSVYFVDSCGNPANIYDSSKYNDVSYWNRVVSTDNSCNPFSGNANSATCGNCNRFLGGICSAKNSSTISPTFGSYFCKDTSCTFNGTNYKNGESWCVYDGSIGNGTDVVGSRHWKAVCNNGITQIEPCADYRNEICVQANTIDVNNTNVSFKNAACRPNNWRACVDLNTQNGNMSECSNTLDCQIFHVNLGSGFAFDMCTPKYPAGFEFSSTGEQDVAQQICGMASRTCTKVFKQKMFGGCVCVSGCNCDTAAFTQTMNDLCTSMGDCGLKSNIVGKYDTSDPSCSVSGAPALSAAWISKLMALSQPVPGQFADVGGVVKYLLAAGVIGNNNIPGMSGIQYAEIVNYVLNQSNAGSSSGNGGSVTGNAVAPVTGNAGIEDIAPGTQLTDLAPESTAPGVTGSGLGLVGDTQAEWVDAATYQVTGGTPLEDLVNPSATATTAIPSLAGFAAGMIAGIIGGIAGSMIAKMLKLSSTGSFLMSTGMGLLAVAGAAYLFPSLSILPVSWIGPMAIIGIVLVIVSLFFGGKKCPPKTITFTCEPWHAPSGGSDCSKCNNDPLKPCSQYRCESLGAACSLLNLGTDHELCADENPNDVNPPSITPDNSSLANGTHYIPLNNGTGIKITGSDGGCVDAFTNINFGLNTNEPAVCKYDIQMNKFEDMQFDFPGGYQYNHTTSFFVPDPQGCGLNWTGQMKLYVKCRDAHGNEAPIGNFYTIDFCVKTGKDTTPAVIRYVQPAANSLLSFNATDENVSFYTNEPAECRWSSTDRDYSVMENSMTCATDCENVSAYGYQCLADLPISNSTTTVYVRCNDQPYLDEVNRSDERNANTQSYNYTLQKVSTPLAIVRVAPNSSFQAASSQTTFTLGVVTSGGAPNPECKYSFSGYDTMIQFFTTFASVHEQQFNLMAGSWRVYIECDDSAGEVVRTEADFEINYDASSPLISRVFKQDGVLKIITDENADCRYSTNDCNFDFANATSIVGSTVHTINGNAGTFYIKCKDGFGNIPDSGSCSIVVHSP